MDVQALIESKPHFFSVFHIFLDRFSLINQSLGTDTGDRLLEQALQRIQKCVGSTSLVFHLQDAQFLVALPGAEETIAADVADNIIADLDRPVEIDEQKLRVSARIGVAQYPFDSSNASRLIQRASLAVTNAQTTAGKVCFFDSTIEKHSRKQLSMELQLLDAIEDSQFEMNYQPRVNCRTLEVVGFEALIRWNHPSKGLVSPADFIPVAEDAGIIPAIGEWIIKQAMQQQQEWQQAGLSLTVSINISPQQFVAGDLLANTSAALASSGCDARMIEFEITESSQLSGVDVVIEKIEALNRLGIKIALDDFGTGYCNLSYLQKYPVHCLKIDRVFIADTSQRHLLSVIIEIGRSLGLQVVAEGVETKEQCSWLIKNQCDQLQGFYFARPMPAADTIPYTLNHNRSPIPS